MENEADTSLDKKYLSKVKSHNDAPSKVAKNNPIKRKSFNVNEAVHSLDLALGRLKRSKMVNGKYNIGSPLTPVKCDAKDVLVDMNTSSSYNYGLENASLMSMNFSHYELMRNLSQANCNSEGAFSGTCSADISTVDSLKNEHLERYFRSAEMWSRNFREGTPSTVPFELPEK